MSKHRLKNILLVAGILTSSLGFVACGDDDDGDDVSTNGGTGGRAPRAGSGGAGGAKAGSGGAGGTGGSSEAGSGGAGGNSSCEGTDGCYDCEPKESIQYLNHCTDSQCEHFDNSRLRLLKDDGTLPELP